METAPTPEQVAEIEARVNEVIAADLPVTIDFVTHEEAAKIVDMSKLPEDVSQTLRIVRIGDYDACACVGAHVESTGEIGQFVIISSDWEEGRWRVRFKLKEASK